MRHGRGQVISERPRRGGSRRRRWWLVVPLGLLAVVVVLAGSGLLVLVVQGRSDPEGGGEYVALGSSFGSGPGITTRAEGSPYLCNRSADNYAHIVARSTGLDLTDMTCSGAVTGDVLDGGQYFQGPQLRAVTPETEVVTITVGGNDVSYLGNLFAWSCAQRPGDVPWLYEVAGVCDERSDQQVADAFEALPGAMTAIVDRIRGRAPDAQVVFVDYTTVLPARGTCDALPITDAQADRARSVAGRLADVTARVAADTGSTLVEASALTAGHDVCSADPWVYGFQWGSNPFGHGTLPFHPREPAMQAIARAVEAAIEA